MAPAGRFLPFIRYAGLVSVGFIEEDRKPLLTAERYVVTVTVAAAIIAAVRLAKVTDLDMGKGHVHGVAERATR